MPGLLIGITGSILIAFAGFCLVAAVWHEVRTGAQRRGSAIVSLPTALLVTVNAFLMLVCIAAMIGLWAG